jgi:hypothetical protein
MFGEEEMAVSSLGSGQRVVTEFPCCCLDTVHEQLSACMLEPAFATGLMHL